MPGVDNVVINPMSGGAVIAADDVAGVKVQRVKVGYGVDGSFTDVAPGKPLPATWASGGTVGSDRAAVATAGTPVALPSHAGIYGVTVRALLGNAGTVYVGGPAVSAATGFELAPGEALSLDVADSAAVFIDAATSGDGVSLVWVGP
jgi:hypothetical protein